MENASTGCGIGGKPIRTSGGTSGANDKVDSGNDSSTPDEFIRPKTSCGIENSIRGMNKSMAK